MPWAILAGALASAFAWYLPGPVERTVGLLADSASPVALFIIGAVLARSQMQAASGQGRAVRWSEAVPVAAIKLLVHPLLVLSVGWVVVAAGLTINRFAWYVVVLVAALPSASNVSMLAERFGADNGRIARIILVSTAFAFLTFSGVVTWLPKP
jgi:predicted permease